MPLKDQFTLKLLTHGVYKLFDGYFSSTFNYWIRKSNKGSKNFKWFKSFKEFVLENGFPPSTSKIRNFPTSLSQFPNFILEKFLNFILHIIYMSVFLNLETTYENKYINNYLISV